MDREPIIRGFKQKLEVVGSSLNDIGDKIDKLEVQFGRLERIEKVTDSNEEYIDKNITILIQDRTGEIAVTELDNDMVEIGTIIALCKEMVETKITTLQKDIETSIEKYDNTKKSN